MKARLPNLLFRLIGYIKTVRISVAHTHGRYQDISNQDDISCTTLSLSLSSTRTHAHTPVNVQHQNATIFILNYCTAANYVCQSATMRTHTAQSNIKANGLQSALIQPRLSIQKYQSG